jgi:hypothetical protein
VSSSRPIGHKAPTTKALQVHTRNPKLKKGRP